MFWHERSITFHRKHAYPPKQSSPNLHIFLVHTHPQRLLLLAALSIASLSTFSKLIDKECRIVSISILCVLLILSLLSHFLRGSEIKFLFFSIPLLSLSVSHPLHYLHLVLRCFCWPSLWRKLSCQNSAAFLLISFSWGHQW